MTVGLGPERLRAIRLQSCHPAAKLEAGIPPTGEGAPVETGGPLILGFGVHGSRAPDNLPIFDCVKDDVFTIADSNYGFKMVGSSKLMDLVSFSVNRSAKGTTFGDRNFSNPWVLGVDAKGRQSS